MATDAAAFNEWASGFGMPAYEEGSVPDGARMPYATYRFAACGFGESTAVQLSIWHGGTDAQANAKAREVCSALSRGGVMLRCDGGALWLRLGSPAWLCANDQGARRRVVNIETESLTS